jgi:hypothetical protein
MKTTILKSVFLLALFAGLFISCINDDDYETPQLGCTETTLVKTKEVSQIPATSTVTKYTANDVIEAYVTSSDKGGNFFKSISFQTKPTDGSNPIGFSVPVDVTSTFINFEPGRKVLIKMQNLYTDVSNGGKRFGGIFVSTSNNPAVGRLTPAEYRTVLNKSCTVIPEAQLARTLTVAQLKNDENINTLVELDGVQFSDAAIQTTYYTSASDLGGATNHLLTDATGNTIIFRTSSFANFAAKPVGQGFGKVKGVLTKFGSDYQFVARDESDINLTEPRIEIDFAPPVVGNGLSFLCSLNEDFESYTAGSNTTGQNNFPKYINDAATGTAYWRCRSIGTPANKYIQMTSFSTSQSVKTYFIVPVDLTCANTFSFQTRTSFNNGAVLKVYYSTNYTAGTKVSNATLVDITSSFAISTSNSNSGPFTPSGIWNIPAVLTGNGHILFEYTGSAISSPALTTNMDIDNIVIN